MYGDNTTRPPHQGARLANNNHRVDTKYRAAINKLSDVLDSRTGNVMVLANCLVNPADEGMRGRLMDFAIAIIDAEADAYTSEGDMSWGPTQGMRLKDLLDTYGVERRA